LAVDFRNRLVVALVTAAVLTLALRQGWISRWPRSVVADLLEDVLQLFLVHFPVCLVTQRLVVEPSADATPGCRWAA